MGGAGDLFAVADKESSANGVHSSLPYHNNL
jgi:hypothetical protein